MKDICYLMIGRDGVKGLLKREPEIRVGTITVKLNLELDDSLFVIPTVQAKITMDKPRETDIATDETVVRVEDALAAAGIKAEVVLIAPEEEGR